MDPESLAIDGEVLDKYKVRYIQTNDFESNKGNGKIQIEQADIDLEKFNKEKKETFMRVLRNVGLSPFTLGEIDVNTSGNYSYETRTHLEQMSIRTRSAKIRTWKIFLQSFVELLLQAQDIMEGKVPTQYEVDVVFPPYIKEDKGMNPKEITEAVKMGIITVEEARAILVENGYVVANILKEVDPDGSIG